MKLLTNWWNTVIVGYFNIYEQKNLQYFSLNIYQLLNMISSLGGGMASQ